MNNKDRFFKGQQSDEELICFFRQHWIVLVKEFVYLTMFLAVCYVTFTNFGTITNILQANPSLQLLFALSFFFATLIVHRFFFKVFNYFVNIGIITNKRIIDHEKTILFRDLKDSINLEQIQNIERLGEGLISNMLGYGDIKIFLSASSAVKTFYFVPNVRFHFRCIHRQHELRKITLMNQEDRQKTNLEEYTELTPQQRESAYDD